jgi:hypothetical protein
MDDFGAKMIGVACQGLGAGDARDDQDTDNGYAQRETTNGIESFLWGRRRVTRRPYSAAAWTVDGRGVSPVNARGVALEGYEPLTLGRSCGTGSTL